MCNVDKYLFDVHIVNLPHVMLVMMYIISFLMLFMIGSMLFCLCLISLIKINLVQNKKMFMNKPHDHLLIQFLKVLMEQYLLMVKLVLEKHLLWKVKIKKKINLILK